LSKEERTTSREQKATEKGYRKKFEALPIQKLPPKLLSPAVMLAPENNPTGKMY
jgi:hypothetical protein